MQPVGPWLLFLGHCCSLDSTLPEGRGKAEQQTLWALLNQGNSPCQEQLLLYRRNPRPNRHQSLSEGGRGKQGPHNKRKSQGQRQSPDPCPQVSCEMCEKIPALQLEEPLVTLLLCAGISQF